MNANPIGKSAEVAAEAPSVIDSIEFAPSN
jgi:hypothetical protein